jgi:hypothetical protein
MRISARWSLAAAAALTVLATSSAGAQTTQSSSEPAPMPSGETNQTGPGNQQMAPAQSGPVVNLPLTENGKPGGKPGMAVLSQRGSDVLVTIQDPAASRSRRDATIAKGACSSSSTSDSGTSSQSNAMSSSAPSTQSNGSSMSSATQGTYKLNPLTHGQSQTVLKGVSVSDLTSGNYKIVVGGSPPLCGELAQANPVPATQQQH